MKDIYCEICREYVPDGLIIPMSLTFVDKNYTRAINHDYINHSELNMCCTCAEFITESLNKAFIKLVQKCHRKAE